MGCRWGLLVKMNSPLRCRCQMQRRAWAQPASRLLHVMLANPCQEKHRFLSLEAVCRPLFLSAAVGMQGACILFFTFSLLVPGTSSHASESPRNRAWRGGLQRAVPQVYLNAAASWSCWKSLLLKPLEGIEQKKALNQIQPLKCFPALIIYWGLSFLFSSKYNLCAECIFN